MEEQTKKEISEYLEQRVYLSKEEYKTAIALVVTKRTRSLKAFQRLWLNTDRRNDLLARITDYGLHPWFIEVLEGLQAYDWYDQLAYYVWSQIPITRAHRAARFYANNRAWIQSRSKAQKQAIRRVIAHFVEAGTSGLERLELFPNSQAAVACKLAALPPDQAKTLIQEIKERLFV